MIGFDEASCRRPTWLRALRAQVAGQGPARRARRRGGGHPPGDGLRDDRRPPGQVGLYTCMVPMVVYALLGGSRTLSVSTTSTVAVLTGSSLLAAGVAAERHRPGRRPGDADAARRGDPARRPAAAPRRPDRQHLRGDADRDQDRRRPHRRRRPAAQAARHRRRPDGVELLRRGGRHRRRPRRRELDHGGLLGGHARRAARGRPRDPPGPGTIARRCARHRPRRGRRRSTNTASP